MADENKEEELTFETCPPARIGEYARQQHKKAKKEQEARIQRVRAVLAGTPELKDLEQILTYYRSEIGMAHYGADRCLNPENY